MTLKEWVWRNYPNAIDNDHAGGVAGCPTSNAYYRIPIVDVPDNCDSGKTDEICRACWNREIPGSDRVPKSGEIYRHFKGCVYLCLGVGKHVDTGEELVFYKAMYGDKTIWARSLWEFVSEVDREKYPNADQKYRFELVEDGECHN